MHIGDDMIATFQYLTTVIFWTVTFVEFWVVGGAESGAKLCSWVCLIELLFIKGVFTLGLARHGYFAEESGALTTVPLNVDLSAAVKIFNDIFRTSYQISLTKIN